MIHASNSTFSTTIKGSFNLPFYDDDVDGDLVDGLVDDLREVVDDSGVTRAGPGGQRLSLSPLD